MPGPRYRRKPLSLMWRVFTGTWILLFGLLCMLALNTFWLSFVNRSSASVIDFLILASPIFFGLGMMAQLRRNAYAYLDGKPRPRIVQRTPRPMRSDTEAQVNPGRGFRGTLSKIVGCVPGYQKLTRHLLD